MPAATVTSKGQITIPAEVRRVLGLRSGSRVDFVRMPDGSYSIAPSTRSVTALRGLIAAPSAPVTVEQMGEAVAAEASDRTSR